MVASIVAVALMAGSLRCRPTWAATAVDYPVAAAAGNRSSDRARTPLRPTLVRAITAFLPFVTTAADRGPESRCSRHTDIYMGQLDDFQLWAAQSKRLRVLRESTPPEMFKSQLNIRLGPLLKIFRYHTDHIPISIPALFVSFIFFILL